MRRDENSSGIGLRSASSPLMIRPTLSLVLAKALRGWRIPTVNTFSCARKAACRMGEKTTSSVSADTRLGVNTLLDLLALISELLSLIDHPLHLFLDKQPLSMVMVIIHFACRFVLNTHIQNLIGINHDGDLNLNTGPSSGRFSRLHTDFGHLLQAPSTEGNESKPARMANMGTHANSRALGDDEPSQGLSNAREQLGVTSSMILLLRTMGSSGQWR